MQWSYASGVNRMPCFDSGGYLREQGIDLLYSPQPFVPLFRNPVRHQTAGIFSIDCSPTFRMSSLVRSLTDSTWTMRERFFAAALPRASAVITGTERGKSEIAHFYRVAEERIHVNPFPVPSGLGRAESRRLSIGSPTTGFCYIPLSSGRTRIITDSSRPIRRLHDQRRDVISVWCFQARIKPSCIQELSTMCAMWRSELGVRSRRHHSRFCKQRGTQMAVRTRARARVRKLLWSRQYSTT